MYSISEFLKDAAGHEVTDVLDGGLYCCESDKRLTLLVNNVKKPISGYSFALVLSGSMTVLYNEATWTLHPNDLFTYSPGFALKILEVTDDYRAVSLFANESMTFETPIIRMMIRAAFFPIVEVGTPKLTLPEQQARHLFFLMKAIEIYLHSDHLFKGESLRMLYALFLLDVMNLHEKAKSPDARSPRSEELFIRFIRLLPRHFMEHHDVAFYANELCITPTYLSRIVKRITGRTVVEYINQMLLMEASWMLSFSDDSIGAIAEALHFSEQGAFTKFFTRHKGVSPKEYRKNN